MRRNDLPWEKLVKTSQTGCKALPQNSLWNVDTSSWPFLMFHLLSSTSQPQSILQKVNSVFFLVNYHFNSTELIRTRHHSDQMSEGINLPRVGIKLPGQLKRDRTDIALSFSFCLTIHWLFGFVSEYPRATYMCDAPSVCVLLVSFLCVFLFFLLYSLCVFIFVLQSNYFLALCLSIRVQRLCAFSLSSVCVD